MNTTHAASLSLRSALALALLALPAAVSLGCVAPADSSADEADDATAMEGDGDVIAPKRFLPTVLEMDARRAAVPSSASVPASSDAVSTGHGINYHNGPIMSGQVRAYYIFYGSWSASDKAILQNFMTDYPGSPNYNINTLYGDQYGGDVVNGIVYSGTATDNYSQGTTLSDAGVFTVVKNAIAAGSLPLDSNGVYFVLSSSDVSESSGFCTQYCGWHTYGTYSNTTLKYSFVGNPVTKCPSACEAQTGSSPNGSPGPDAMISVIAHELEETTSDPQLNAWYDSSGYENADKCAWTFGTTFTASNGSMANMQLHGKQYLVQQNWLNSGSGSCAVGYGQLSAHGGGGGSRFDTGCYAGAVAVGVVGRSGTLIDNLGLVCATLNSNGSVSASTYTTTQYGGSGGGAFTKQCPSGQVMVGLSGRSGSQVDQLTLKCSTPTTWASSGTVQSTVFVGGGSGGGAFDDSCPQGYTMNRVTGRSGTLIDQVQGGCTKIWSL